MQNTMTNNETRRKSMAQRDRFGKCSHKVKEWTQPLRNVPCVKAPVKSKFGGRKLCWRRLAWLFNWLSSLYFEHVIGVAQKAAAAWRHDYDPKSPISTGGMYRGWKRMKLRVAVVKGPQKVSIWKWRSFQTHTLVAGWTCRANSRRNAVKHAVKCAAAGVRAHASSRSAET